MPENLMLQTECTLTNINSRIEHHGEDKILAADLTFLASIKAEELDQLAPVTNDVSKTFWKSEGDQPAKYPQFGKIKADIKFENHKLFLSLDSATDIRESKAKIVIDPVNVCKFNFEPQLAAVALTQFTVQAQVKGAELGKLNDQYLAERVMLLIEPINGDLLDAT